MNLLSPAFKARASLRSRALAARLRPVPHTVRAPVRTARQVWRQALAAHPQALFWRELLAEPGAVGAVCASSPWLAARMAAQVDLAAEGLVVELGGGTGVITAALLNGGLPPERLVVVERAAKLASLLQRRFPQVCVLHADALDLPHLPALCAAGLPQRPVGTIVSGLPLRSIAEPLRQHIMAAAVQVLAPQGRVVQFTYALGGPSPWESAGLHPLRNEKVLANLPPARVDVLVR